MTAFFEKMFFSPKWYHYVLMVLLFPFSIVYGIGMLLRRITSKKSAYDIPIISIGNLQIGGSGKTPFVISLASRYKNVTIISRGYGRRSKGLVEVSSRGEILVDVKQSGDEAMLMAISLDKASVIVSENRTLAIELAIKNHTELILLDDGFNRVNIEKFEVLLEPKCIPNQLTLPAGPLREFLWSKRYAHLILKEEQCFHRVVSYENLTDKMLLVTAISNPTRLDAYLPQNIVGKIYLEDHAYFNKEELKQLMKDYGATSLLVTQKDAVKMHGFSLPLSLMKLTLKIEEERLDHMDRYIQSKVFKHP